MTERLDGRAVGTQDVGGEWSPADASDVPAPRFDRRGVRAALIAFVVVEAVALPLLLWFGRHAWFIGDEWDFLAERTGGNLGDLLRPHVDHWVTLPILLYRLLWWGFGLRTYAPYLVLTVVLHLAAAALLRVVMRRAGVGPWISTISAALLVFFGAGAENIFVAFQMTLLAALVLGLVHLLLADHDGPVDRRDWYGLGAGVAALMCSGVAIPMALAVGIVTIAKRGWRIALLHTAPLAVVYASWWLLKPSGRSTSPGHASSAGDGVRFVVIGFEAAFGRLGQVPGVGLPLAAMLVVGFGAAVNATGARVLRGPAAAPIALFAAAILFLVLTAFSRAGRFGGFFLATVTGPEHARASRYVYVVVAMILPAVALAADAIARRGWGLAVVVGVLLLVGLPGNIHRLDTYVNRSAIASYRRYILAAPRLPLARQLPRSVETGVGVVPGPPLGWLPDSEPAGLIPSPGRMTRDDIATETLMLALGPSSKARAGTCQRVRRPTVRELRRGDRITVIGAVNATYLPADGGTSQPVRLTHTRVALAGPLRVRLAPAGRATICISRV